MALIKLLDKTGNVVKDTYEAPHDRSSLQPLPRVFLHDDTKLKYRFVNYEGRVAIYKESDV
jgi:hypothetical protein